MGLVVKAGCVPMEVLMPHPSVAVLFPPLIFLQPIGLELTAPCRCGQSSRCAFQTTGLEPMAACTSGQAQCLLHSL